MSPYSSDTCKRGWATVFGLQCFTGDLGGFRSAHHEFLGIPHLKT